MEVSREAGRYSKGVTGSCQRRDSLGPVDPATEVMGLIPDVRSPPDTTPGQEDPSPRPLPALDREAYISCISSHKNHFSPQKLWVGVMLR